MLEQIRLLSNLETDKQKLLQIVLMGQPELKDVLAREELRQLRQRILVHYELHPLVLSRHRSTTSSTGSRSRAAMGRPQLHEMGAPRDPSRQPRNSAYR